ncbi:MAG: LysM peptidoglycan-binding domain-containing protein [Chloroflexi bacterium]|nr:LysM peptidoglycan-binding domain-containing protein [Chloroflexota bacterium]
MLAGVAILFLLITPAVYADKLHDGGYVWYRVRAGDTLSALAQRYHTSVRAIRRANNLKSSLIRSGRRLKIPVSSNSPVANSFCGNSVRVRRGDTLRRIASRCHVSVRQIKQWNRLKNNKLRAGQKLKLGAAPQMTPSLEAVQLPLYQRALPPPIFPPDQLGVSP